MKINYDKNMQDIIEKLDSVPKLLLHSCCAPCSSYCIEQLSNHFFVTVYFYNPNIDSQSEYEKRAIEQKKFVDSIKTKYPINYIDAQYTPDDFVQISRGLEHMPERGERCFLCYNLRLEKTAKYAKEHDFDYFATTLTLSPLKSVDKLNELGSKLQDKLGVKYLCSDFKKREGYKKSLALSEKYQLYRQNYCGCVFSKRRENV